MKRLITIIFCIAIAGILTACGSQSNSSSGEKNKSTSSDKKVIQLGHIDPAQDLDPYHILATNFKDNVEVLSNGSIEIDIVSDAQLGSELSMLEGMKMQTIDAAVITNFSYGSFIPAFMAFDLPYLFETREQAHMVLDDESIMEGLEQDMYDQFDVKILSWGESGFRSVINSSRPIKDVKDLKGIKIRVPENPIYVDTFKALGANPTTMASDEVFTGLQQGTIDGLEQPITPMYTYKTYEISNYISFTEHFYSPISLSVSKNIWESLSDEEKGWLEEAAQQAAADERISSYEVDMELLDEMKSSGADVNEIVDKTPFRQAVQPVYDDYKDQIGEDLLNKIEGKLSQ